jgi:ABC-type antimicrobial peptide transport system permease subunit
MTAFVRTVQTAMRALRRNVTRSALTCLGIIMGIAAVIAMMEIGNGISELNARKIASLGANNLSIQPGQAASGGVSWGAGSVTTLTPEDCDAIIKDCPAVRAAAPMVRANAVIIYGNKNWNPMELTGTTPAYLDVRQWPIDDGSCFTDGDVRNQAKVCLIGQTIKREVFGQEDPVGKDIRLGNVSMRIVGVLTRKGASMFGSDQDDVVLAPWTTIKHRVSGKGDAAAQAQQAPSASSSSASTAVNSLNNLYPNASVQLYPTQSQTQAADTPIKIGFDNIRNINVAAKSGPEIPVAMRQITELLRERHRIREGQPEDFQIRDMTELSDTMTASQNLISTLLLIVAAISLAVGGVGIMNIMLVSVTERTREIGLRMAVGARARDILTQFLVEAVLLCLLGGAIGILIGRGTSLLVRTFQHWPTAVSVPAIVVSVIVSAMVGIVFGFYPAWKASRLDPIEALRYE